MLRIILHPLPKHLLSFLIIFLSLTLSSQETISYRNIFVRVYNQEGKKIGKGFLKSVTDSTLILAFNKHSKSIPIKTIKTIKTKHSTGNNILVGSGTGAVIGTAIGVSTANSDSLSQAAGTIFGFGGGAAAGALVGGVIAITKKKKTYNINGAAENLKLFANDYVK